MRAMVLIVLLLMVPASGTALALSSQPTAKPVGAFSHMRPLPTPIAVSDVGVFDAYLTSAFAAGAFVGALVVQVVTTSVLAPAVTAAAPPVGAAAAIVLGSVYAYDAIVTTGGVGGGLFGTWLYSRHSPAP